MTRPDLNELVLRARSERAAPGALAGVARRLRVPFSTAPVAAALVPATALASGAVKSGSSWLALLGWGAGSTVAVTTVAVALTLSAPPPLVPAPTPVPPAARASGVRLPPAPTASEPAGAAEPPSPSPEKAMVRSQPSLDEPQLIERARRALASEPRRALALTHEHERRFPAGALSVEREVIALEALMRCGQLAEARRRALRFEASHPGSIHLPRVRALLSRLAAE